MDASPRIKGSLPSMSYYFISGNIPDEFGGLTTSLLLRSKLFGELQQTPTNFLTFGFDAKFREKEEQFYRDQKIDANYTSLINLYESYLSDVTVGKRTYSEKIDLSTLIKQKQQSTLIKKMTLLFGRSLPEYELTPFDQSEAIQYVTYPVEKKREEYRKDGTIATVSYYQHNQDTPYLVEYVNADQLIYLDKTYTLDTQKNEYTLSKINWYSDEGNVIFNKESDMRQHWIKSIQKASNEPKLFLVDSRPQDRHILRLSKEKNSYYATILHSKHYGKNKSTLKQRFKELMANRLNLDAIFFLTKEQLNDFRLLT